MGGAKRILPIGWTGARSCPRQHQSLQRQPDVRQNWAPLVDRGWRGIFLSRKTAVCVWLSLAVSVSEIDHTQSCIGGWWSLSILDWKLLVLKKLLYCFASSDVFSTFRIIIIYSCFHIVIKNKIYKWLFWEWWSLTFITISLWTTL